MEKCALSAIRTTGMAVNQLSDTVTECHYKLSYTEKNHRPLWTKHSTQYELSFQKVLDRDKKGLMLSQAFISVEYYSLLITQFHTSIKVFCNEPFVSKARYLGAAVNVQQQ